ncbi:radical SAM/SPASM domain-containing protein [Streptomyces specialis]|uniref:radical SAM/SPASM domain-containing protein n=1 Tax=Streptomyces specialis TaxID=498367 RepID=UPI001F2CF774|nr:radical SAM protein [Streptomyces specialis]
MSTISNVSTADSSAERSMPRFLWLDLTRKCQLACVHCYNASGPDGTHGTMTRQDWINLLDQAAASGVRSVQLIGGEPTMHPDFTDLVEHALSLRLKVEVFSNMVRLMDTWWELFQREGVSLATSYYSDQSGQHNAMTGRPSHGRTRTNIAKAVQLGIPLRVGIIVGSDQQRAVQARRELEALGVRNVHIDRVRPFGRGAQGSDQDAGNLCGQCGTGKAAIGPTGEVSPCVFSGWLGVGNVRDTPLAAILSGIAMARANDTIRGATKSGQCDPGCEPNAECDPGYPLSDCSPRT